MSGDEMEEGWGMEPGPQRQRLGCTGSTSVSPGCAGVGSKLVSILKCSHPGPEPLSWHKACARWAPPLWASGQSLPLKGTPLARGSVRTQGQACVHPPSAPGFVLTSSSGLGQCPPSGLTPPRPGHVTEGGLAQSGSAQAGQYSVGA